jgi:hypothetical protein
MTKRKTTKALPAKPSNPNDRYLVLRYENTYKDEGRTYTVVTAVYLLNPGAFYHGFGGSRSARAITKTASLITRTTGPWGLRDYETDIDSKEAWAGIAEGIATATAFERLTPAVEG